MYGSTVDIQSPTAEIRRGKKKKERRKKIVEITGQKYNGLPYYIGRMGDHKNSEMLRRNGQVLKSVEGHKVRGVMNNGSSS